MATARSKHGWNCVGTLCGTPASPLAARPTPGVLEHQALGRTWTWTSADIFFAALDFRMIWLVAVQVHFLGADNPYWVLQMYDTEHVEAFWEGRAVSNVLPAGTVMHVQLTTLFPGAQLLFNFLGLSILRKRPTSTARCTRPLTWGEIQDFLQGLFSTIHKLVVQTRRLRFWLPKVGSGENSWVSWGVPPSPGWLPPRRWKACPKQPLPGDLARLSSFGNCRKNSSLLHNVGRLK